MKADEIERMFPWGPAKRVPTRYGLRMLRKVLRLSGNDRVTFQDNEAELTRCGIRLEGDGLVWWQKVKEEVPPAEVARTETRDILNNQLASTVAEVEAQGGRVIVMERVRNGYRLTISWPAERKVIP